MGDTTGEIPELPNAKRDGTLEFLIQVVDGTSALKGGSLPIDVTLAVNGMLVSGRIISHEEWLRDYVKWFPEEAAAKLLEGVKAGDRDECGRNFIHLKDARFFTPGQLPIPGNHGVF